MFSCLWYRSRLEAHAAGRLEGRVARWVGRHVAGCQSCRRTVDVFTRVRALVRAVAPRPAEPDWSGFWPAVRLRIETEVPRPFRDAWWRPLWKPVWGHPRVATSAAMAGALLFSVALWPAGHELAPGAPVLVQDVATSDPNGSVMVYNKDDMTVIWVFAADHGATDD